MTKKIFWCIVTIVAMLGMMGCNAGYTASQSGGGQNAVTNDNGDNADPLKATALQSVVNNAKAGDTIDLSEYKEITDYTATIRKPLTIRNGSLKGATLSVANDEVTLAGLTDLSIKTNSSVSLDECEIVTLEYTDIPDGDEGRGGRGGESLKIASSSLSSLNLTNTNVTDGINLNTSLKISESGLSGLSISKPLTINCTAGKLGYDLPSLTLDEYSVSNVRVTTSGYGNNTFSNGSTKITSLAGAISLPLPGTTTTSTTTTTIKQSGTITVKGDGEVTVTNLDDKDNNKLLKITPYSGFNSIITEGQQPDFSKLIMLDTFAANNVKVFKAGGLTFEKTDTVSKLEKDFTVTINGVEYYKNGKVMLKTPLAVGKYPAKITSDYNNCDDGYEFDFTFTVMEKKVDAVLTLESITIVPNNSMKTVYKVGDRLNLNGLIVVGNYTYGDVSYQNVITDYTLTPDNGTILSAGDNSVTVYADGKTTTIPIEVKPAYTFTFVIAKDYTVDYQVTSGETQEALKNFNVEGASFGGWFTDSSYKTEFDFDTPITQNISVYAKWSNPIVYNNVCDAANPNPTSYTDSEDIALEDLTRVGYTFGGWYDASADGTIVTGWSAGDKAGLVELWVGWTPIAYTIVLNANSGSGESISLNAVYDESVTLPTAEGFTAPTGLVFGSWNTKADGMGSSYSAGQEVINFADTNGTIVTLYAQWIDKAAFKITYNNTLNADNPNPASFLESQDVTIAPIAKAGYTFGGWYDASANGTIVTGWSAGSKTADVTLYARWTENVHSITYQNTKNVTNPNAATFRELDNVILTNLGNTTGYTFDGWYDAADGGNKVSGWESLAQTSDVTLYAHWTAIGYTIRFNANGGSGSMSNLAMTYDTAKALTANAFTRTGYTFLGWGEAANATAAKYTDKQSVNNLTATAGVTVTLYAVWKANTYTIKFNANGGTGSMSNLSMTYGISKALTPNSFTKSGYSFLGWSTSSSAVSAVYNDKQTVNNLSSAAGATVTLYAVWMDGENLIINGVEYLKTSFKTVLSSTASFPCDQSSGVFKSSNNNVSIGAYSICRYLVTQQLYMAVMGNNPSHFTEMNAPLDEGETLVLLRPVENVSRYDAMVFCNRLSTLMGRNRCYKLSDGTYPEDASVIPSSYNANWGSSVCDMSVNGYRLPTETEWECAARGGFYSTTVPWVYEYSGSNTINDVAWYSLNSNNHTWEVGLKQPNTLGLFDMNGNVWEWCWTKQRVLGGSFNSEESHCSVFYGQGSNYLYGRSSAYGLRLVYTGVVK